jgi:hypothetical protein
LQKAAVNNELKMPLVFFRGQQASQIYRPAHTSQADDAVGHFVGRGSGLGRL